MKLIEELILSVAHLICTQEVALNRSNIALFIMAQTESLFSNNIILWVGDRGRW